MYDTGHISYMSIKLRFEKGSLSTQVTLKDEALEPLQKVVFEFLSDEPSTSKGSSVAAVPLEGEVKGLDEERLEFARSWFKKHSGAELVTQIGWQNFPERIAVLGAHYEATSSEQSWRSADIESAFKSARIPAPANFARDIGKAINLGIVATVTPRTYRVSRTGWLKLYDGIIRAQAQKTTGEQTI